MTTNERRELFCHSLTANTPLCTNCKHFYQHFLWDGNRFRAANSGHCGFPRLKLRMAYDTCKHFREKDDGDD